jgi:type VI secretion system protein ImpF
MNRAAKTPSLPLPLLDRLIDEPLPQDQELRMSPDRQQKNGSSMARLRAELVRRDLARLRLEAIRRDLEVLLNTRRSVVSFSEAPGELSRSVLDYGLAAVRGSGPISPGHRESLRKEVESAIQRFEPRLVDVRVVLEADPGPSERLRLRIDAAIAGTGSPVSLQASLDSSTGRFGLREDLP